MLFCVQWWALECIKKGSGSNIFVFLGSVAYLLLIPRLCVIIRLSPYLWLKIGAILEAI